MQKEGEGNDLLQKHPAKEYKKWIAWRGCQVHTPNWQQELVGILGINNFQELVQKIRASFEVPWAKSQAQDVENDYSVPPAPKCICWKEFLSPQDPMFPSQVFREGQSQKTLAYAQTIQYWTEKANLPMAGLTMPFGKVCSRTEVGDETLCGLHGWHHPEGGNTSGGLLEGWTWAPILVETLLAPITEELEGTQAQELRVPPIPWEAEEPTDEPAPKEEPTDKLATKEEPLMNQPLQRGLLKNQPPQRSLLLNWPFQWPLSGSWLRSLTPPLCSARREKRGKFHAATFLHGHRCYILPG